MLDTVLYLDSHLEKISNSAMSFTIKGVITFNKMYLKYQK